MSAKPQVPSSPELNRPRRRRLRPPLVDIRRADTTIFVSHAIIVAVLPWGERNFLELEESRPLRVEGTTVSSRPPQLPPA